MHEQSQWSSQSFIQTAELTWVTAGRIPISANHQPTFCKFPPFLVPQRVLNLAHSNCNQCVALQVLKFRSCISSQFLSGVGGEISISNVAAQRKERTILRQASSVVGGIMSPEATILNFFLKSHARFCTSECVDAQPSWCAFANELESVESLDLVTQSHSAKHLAKESSLALVFQLSTAASLRLRECKHLFSLAAACLLGWVKALYLASTLWLSFIMRVTLPCAQQLLVQWV